ncbi:hypothetical protein B0I32_109172 [Nonomuraea fuscirosea]|uniref:Uncharacterized protein n=1 Tax=Nonomuraea fuscirosea TaxID=1291556 RepID=A0A2T0MYC2_9ACTN|nr:hypothetical protein [Nonomuraea fuscirosea]PRX64244.1 hypothetical protein B0I32_109172 [Nonomuraea fuscirosea]
MLGDITIMQVQQGAASAQGREWAWFVHERNIEVRSILDGQGIAYARIRFVATATSATSQVFLSKSDNVGDWAASAGTCPRPTGLPGRPRLHRR